MVTLKVLGLKVSVRDGVLKMTRGSMVILKSIRCNNLYYLNGSTVTRKVVTSINSGDDSIRLWYIRLGYTGEKSLQALAKQGLLEGVKTCKLDFVNIALSERR